MPRSLPIVLTLDRGKNLMDWKKKHWLSIQQNYSKAAAFKFYAKDIEGIFSREWSSLNELNTHIFRMMLGWLDINCRVKQSSEMKSVGKGSELVLNLCQEVGARKYLSGIGGQSYLEEAAFLKAGVEIVYCEAKLPSLYPQLHPRAEFLNNLSDLSTYQAFL